MSSHEDAIASSVLASFYSLPRKAKPRQYADGTREWTTLSGIVLSKDADEKYTCVSLGTGIKCLPAVKIPLANGICVHDWHAEILCIRAFNLFVIEECMSLAKDPNLESSWLRRAYSREAYGESLQPFAVRDDVRIDMYCSEVPCGDASMELTMMLQNDSTPWVLKNERHSDSTDLDGRGHFSELGVVRRKPGRGDAPVTKSKSCSDKLALRQVTSLLSSISSLLVSPRNAYIRTLVLPGLQYCSTSIDRAFGSQGRMRCVGLPNDSQNRSQGYHFHAFNVGTTLEKFTYSRSTEENGQTVGSGTNIAALWTPNHVEVLIGGTIQGHKQFSTRGSSLVCRARLWQSALHVAQILTSHSLLEILEQPLYSHVKQSSYLAQRRAIKEQAKSTALRGWVPNDGDESFGL